MKCTTTADYPWKCHILNSERKTWRTLHNFLKKISHYRITLSLPWHLSRNRLPVQAPGVGLRKAQGPTRRKHPQVLRNAVSQVRLEASWCDSLHCEDSDGRGQNPFLNITSQHASSATNDRELRNTSFPSENSWLENKTKAPFSWLASDITSSFTPG